MVRNSKRKAFTIVELVIVIAVIAILAAVMIPTFGGVIESANVSADKQMLSGMNSQISIYIGTGNKIETEADLWEALKGEKTTGGTDFTTKLNPKSAKHGYHYFYESASQTVKLLEYTEATEGTALRATGKMLVRAGGLEVRAAGEDFALASPRSFMPGYYFLDKVADGEGNDFSKLFDKIENLSAVENDENYDKAYKDAKTVITNLSNRDDNKDFAEKLVERLNVTAILTDKDPITNGGEVDHVYIPENKTDDKDYTLKSGSISISAKFNVTVTLPENVNPGEALNVITEQLQTQETPAALKVDATITFETEEELAEKIGEIFGVGSVTGGTITINGSITASATEKEVVIGEQTIALKYQNPVTGGLTWVNGEQVYVDGKFDVSASNLVSGGCIALHNINNPEYKLNLVKGDLADASGAKTFYQDVKWEIVSVDDVPYTYNAETSAVWIDEDGVTVKFNPGFTGTTIKFKATPVALNEGDAIPVGEFTLTVVKINNVNFDFVAPGGTQSSSVTSSNTLFVNCSDETATAEFKNYTFTYVKNNGDAAPAGVNFAELGVPAPAVTTTTNYFSVTNGKIALVKTAIQGITTVGTQAVEIDVPYVGKYTVNVEIKPRLFAVAHPTYADGYTYTVGDANPISLGKLFKMSTLFASADLANTVITVETYTATKGEGGIPFSPEKVGNSVEIKDANWASQDIQLSQGTNLVYIGTNDNRQWVWVNVVPGKNFEAGDALTNMTKNNGGKAAATYDETFNFVLHDDFNIDTNPDGIPDIKLGTSKKIYGNYFKITAKHYIDTKQSDQGGGIFGFGMTQLNKNGYSLIIMGDKSEMNQLIIDGPVYPEVVIPTTDQKGYFCFAINTSNTVTINDSYIFGFLSPIRVNGGILNLNRTVLEGGTFANLFISKATEVVLNDSTTVQNMEGYRATTNDKAQTPTNANVVWGMGIYISDDFKSTDKLNIKIEGKSEQHNWFNEDMADFLGGNADTAMQIIYAKDSNGAYVYNDMIHDSDYVNAAILYQNTSTDVLPEVSVTGSKGNNYGDKDVVTKVTDPLVGVVPIDTRVAVWSPAHITEDENGNAIDCNECYTASVNVWKNFANARGIDVSKLTK